MMIGRLPAFGLSLVLCLSAAQTASAQRFFGSRTNSLPSLAAYEAVQKELGISGEAAEKLSSLADDYRNAVQKEYSAMGIDYSAIGDLPAAERNAELRKVAELTMQANRKVTAKFLPKMEELLSPEQINRLRQIQLQASGIEVWSEPEIAKELDLSEEQKALVAELRSEYNRRQQQLDGDFQQRFARIREMNTERDAKALELLNDVQKAKLAELKGKPFDVSQLSFRRR